MHFGVLRERMPMERRVAITPSTTGNLLSSGHSVVIETGAGAGAGFSDSEYVAAGAEVVDSATAVADAAGALVKVHGPMADEIDLLRDHRSLIGFLHMSSAPAEVREAMQARHTTAYACELIEERNGVRPVLQPWSDMGGRVAISLAERHLLVSGGGAGRLLGGAPGVPPLSVVIIGAGAAGESAARAAAALGATVTVLDRDTRPLARVARRLPGVATAISSGYNLSRYVANADVLIGAVAIPGRLAPRVLRRYHVRTMRPGSIFLDMSIDDGGCSETSHPSTHDAPVYEVDGVRHICLPNLGAEAAHTSSQALANSLLPYLCMLDQVESLPSTPVRLARVFQAGKLVHAQVAEALGVAVDFTPTA